jgi:hypothetical protein
MESKDFDSFNVGEMDKIMDILRAQEVDLLKEEEGKNKNGIVVTSAHTDVEEAYNFFKKQEEAGDVYTLQGLDEIESKNTFSAN